MTKKLIVIILFCAPFLIKSQDSCSFKFTVDCPKSEEKFWNGIAILMNKDSNYFFAFYNTQKKIPYGEYKMTLYSQFDDKIDTTITLNSNSQKTTIKIKWKYQFNAYTDEIFKNNPDTIIIKYEYHFCCGGIDCSNRDKLYFYKTSDDKYLLKYYNSIDTDETSNDSIREKLLDKKKIKELEKHISKNNILYDDNKVLECTVKIGRSIYVMKNGSYLSFRKQLIE